MSRVLNPELLARLELAVKKGLPEGLPGRTVKVANRGQAAHGVLAPDPFSIDKRVRFDISHFGEAYQVCCPGCNDSRHRLWVNHRWGTLDPASNRPNYALLKCFNENCQSNPGFIDSFKDRLCDILNMVGQHTSIAVSANVEDPARMISLPGPVVSFKDLPDDNPGAIFLRSRGFNPGRLSANFKVGWCPSSRTAQANHRIVVPIVRDGQLRGWQARYVDPQGGGDCKNCWICGNTLCRNIWKNERETNPEICPICKAPEPSKVVKWYTGYGTQVGQLLLNYDIARSYNFGVVMEGPHDVFRLGSPTHTEIQGPGMAAFNHRLTPIHVQMLLNRWGPGGVVFLAFDQDVFSTTLTQFYELLPMFPDRLVPVVFPAGKDPGDLTHSELWDCLRDSCKGMGIPLPF